MNRQQAKELLPIMQAYAEGKEIDIKTKEGSEWSTLEEDDMQYIDFTKCDLRIKPKYRPFKNKEDCWEEMQKHQPLGWIKDTSTICNIINIQKTGVFIYDDITNCYLDFINAFNLKFADGTPFGIMEN